jgi:hypothetical protein
MGKSQVRQFRTPGSVPGMRETRMPIATDISPLR